jgi:hypothetical protein
MMRSASLALIITLFLVLGVKAQSPADGHFESNAYVNTYFRVSYAWPQFLTPYDPKSLNLPQSSPNASEFLIFSARQGHEPFGVIMFAEKLNVPTRHTSGIKSGADFLDRAIQTFDPKGNPKILSRKHVENQDGLAFDELDYMIDGEYSSGITTQVGQFLIVFKCNAKTVADLAKMTESATALHTLR